MLLPVLQALLKKLTEHGFSLAHIKAVMPLSGEALKKLTTTPPLHQSNLTKFRLLAHGKPEVYIASSSKENADGSVTVSSAEGSATAAAW